MTSARTGMALAVAGAAGGLTLLSGGAAAVAATAPHGGPVGAGNICRYEVIARHGLNVHQTPRGKIIPPPLKYGLHIDADCRPTHGGWVEVHGGVPVSQRHGWVFRHFLKLIKPRGGASAGAGGASAAANPMLAGAGLGAIALGGGVAVAARRRRAQGAA
ncbi:hypothetical protein GCM10009527_005500 [Actinomadura nitritigenes]|uniref:SH3 domain-containing protein n=1 Tax=Actinomadura nitritigenes TaxID=134602 RepID=A0ABS3RF40_9ACTN|nr:hypothetical protein [Actinomadura nitritigenes]MBO2444662.1 hypothetical protein [Actinomadura nitritigenes]